MDEELIFEGKSYNLIISKGSILHVKKLHNDPNDYMYAIETNDETFLIKKLHNDPDDNKCAIKTADSSITYYLTEDYESVMHKIIGEENKTSKNEGNIFLDALFNIFLKE